MWVFKAAVLSNYLHACVLGQYKPMYLAHGVWGECVHSSKVGSTQLLRETVLASLLLSSFLLLGQHLCSCGHGGF